MTGTIGLLALSMTVFVLSHVLLSAPPIRTALVQRSGERPFLLVYSAVAAVLLAWVVFAYADAPPVVVWAPPTGLRHVSLSVMLLAFILVAAGVTTPNPSLVGVDAKAVAARDPVGILKVTRHPAMWGVGLWGISHLLANGDAAGMVLFGGMTILALGGALAIDHKKKLLSGGAWRSYCAKTSYLPFGALATGRTHLRLGEIGYWRLALGVALYVLLLGTHGALFGVDPWPL